MKRNSTRRKERKVLREFQKILRSGRDYTTESMYREVSEKLDFLEPKTVGNIVRSHYRNRVTSEMIEFVENSNGNKHRELVECFSDEFGVCERESRLLIRYINR